MDHYVELMLDRTVVRVSLEDDLAQAKAQWKSSDHNHAAWELHILLQGTCQVDMEHGCILLEAPEALLIAPGQFHRACSLKEAPERFSMTFTLNNGPLQRSLQAAIPCYRTYSLTEEIGGLCRSIYMERCHNRPFRRAALQNLLSLLLIRNFTILNVFDVCDAAPPSPRKYTELIDAFFERSTSEHITLDTLAQELHLSRTHANRILKKHYGVTFREKLISTRMKQAAWLLRHTDERIDRIAEDVGYGSFSAFHEMFRKQMGTTPEQYRRASREEKKT